MGLIEEWTIDADKFKTLKLSKITDI